jgi:hypothetical protein
MFRASLLLSVANVTLSSRTFVVPMSLGTKDRGIIKLGIWVVSRGFSIRLINILYTATKIYEG